MRSEKEIRERLKKLEDEPELSIDEFAADILRWVLEIKQEDEDDSKRNNY